MNSNKWIRQFHRWMSLAFTATVIANFAAMTKGQPVLKYDEWVKSQQAQQAKK